MSIQQWRAQSYREQGEPAAQPQGKAKARKSLLSRLILSVKQIGWGTQMTIQTRSFVMARLLWRRWRAQPRAGGVFRFPFGPVRYNDMAALLSLYREIVLEQNYAVTTLPPAPSIIDCGANIGMSAIWFKQRYPESHLKVFEADPAIADILEENLRANGLLTVEVVRCAVSGTPGMLSFLPDGAVGGRVSEGMGIPVEAVRLSDHMGDQPVDLLKIDIEGSEFGVVHDLCESGKIRFIQHLICEVHGTDDVQAHIAPLWTQLSQSGFLMAIKEARILPELPGPGRPTPFSAVESSKFLFWIYAWRPV